MHSINSILVPVDFSTVSANAVRYALRLADQLDAGIDLLHVIPPSDDSLLGITLNVQHIDLGKEKLADLFTKAMVAVSGELKHAPAVRSYVVNGRLRSTMLRHVAAERNDLIVMGTHGEDHELADEIFGSHTSKLVGVAPCPVLVVPQGFTFRPIHSICFATDLMHIDAFHAGSVLKALRVFKPRLDFVHVKTGKKQKTNFNMELLREVFRQPDAGIETRFHVLEDDDVAEEVLEYAEGIDSDLVVMHRPRRSWLSRLFYKSNTREAVLEAKLPLLILPQVESAEQRNEEPIVTEVA